MSSNLLGTSSIILPMNSSIKISKIHIFCVNILITSVVYGLFFQMKFTVDTYVHIYSTAEHILSVHMSMGRPLAAVITFFIRKLGINDGLNQMPYVVSLVLAIGICSTAIVFEINKYSRLDNITKIVLAEIASLVIFINVFFVSWFMYTEASVLMALGAICSVFAAIIVTNVEKPILRYTISFCLLLMSICLYQVFMALYVIISCMFLLLKHNSNSAQKCIGEIVVVLLITLAAIFANLSLTEALCQRLDIPLSNRTASLNPELVFDNVRKIVEFQPFLWLKSMLLMPKYTLLIPFCLVLGISLSLVLTKKNSILKKLTYILVLIGTYILVFSPHLVSPVFWPAERTLFPLFAIFALMVVVILSSTNKRVVLSTILIVSLCFSSLSIIEIQDIASDQQTTNSIDEEYSKLIASEIAEHEFNTGIEVKYIGVVGDIAPSYGYYDQVDKIVYDTNVTARAYDWTFLSMLNYYTNKNYTQKEVPEDVYTEFFENRNWDLFDPSEQFVFMDDSLYICYY